MTLTHQWRCPSAATRGNALESLCVNAVEQLTTGAVVVGGLVFSNSQRRFLHTVLVALGFVHTLQTPQLSLRRHPSHSRHRFRLVRLGFFGPPDKSDEGYDKGEPFMNGTPTVSALNMVGVLGTSVFRLGVIGVLSSGDGPLAGVSGE